MALITVALLKDYLRVEHDADDALLADMRTSVIAAIGSWMGTPVIAEERTFLCKTKNPHGARFPWSHVVYLPIYPIVEPITSMVDADGEDITADISVDYRSGEIRYSSGNEFSNGPYTVVCDVGLEAFEEFDTLILPALNRAIRDQVADDYQRRNPAAEGESEGGGVSVKYRNERHGVTAAGGGREDLGIPRVMDALARWRQIPF